MVKWPSWSIDHIWLYLTISDQLIKLYVSSSINIFNHLIGCYIVIDTAFVGFRTEDQSYSFYWTEHCWSIDYHSQFTIGQSTQIVNWLINFPSYLFLETFFYLRGIFLGLSHVSQILANDVQFCVLIRILTYYCLFAGFWGFLSFFAFL